MKKRELVRESIHIIVAYYDGDLQPYFDAIADDVLWVGPREGQVLRGKDAIEATWAAAEHDLRFTMGNIEALSADAGSGSLEVLLKYPVLTHFPDGTVDRHQQRLHLSWGLRKQESGGARVPKICMIHIDNVAEEQDAGEAGTGDGSKVKVYASSPAESRLDAIEPPSLSRIWFRALPDEGESELTCFFNSATVLWIESADRSLHSVVHTLEGAIKSVEKLRSFEERYPDLFLRAHASYLVNPLHVRSTRRFEVEMADGAKIPVPQKKYTAFRERLESWGDPGAL